MTESGETLIRTWVEVAVGKALTAHCSALKSCEKFVKSVDPFFIMCNIYSLLHRVPSIAFAERLKAKSNCMVLAVSNDDPATTHGATQVLLNLKKYTPAISPCGEVSLRTEVNGDQGFCEKFRQGVYSRTEEDAEHRLSCLLPLPQDWHAQKVNHLFSEICHQPAPGAVLLSG